MNRGVSILFMAQREEFKEKEKEQTQCVRVKESSKNSFVSINFKDSRSS